MAKNLGDKPIDDLHDPAETFDPLQWAMHGLLSTYYDLEAGRPCPAVSDLWRYAIEGNALGSNEAHVQDCPRCQKNLQRICDELEHSTPSTVGRSVRSFLPFITGGLAVAACLMLIVIILPERTARNDRFASQIASAFEAIDVHGESTLRGGQAEDGSPHAVHDEWLSSLLSDREAMQALNELVLHEPTLVIEYKAGRVKLQNNRLVLALGVDKQSAMGRRLIELLQQDNDACERAVSALIRHIPGASKSNRADLRRALDRWRAKEVFGADS